MKIAREIGRYARSLLSSELLKGLAVTGRHLFTRNFTIQFPKQETPQSPRFEGLQALRRYPSGATLHCLQAVRGGVPRCCITIDAEARADGTRRATRHDIDLFKCSYCRFCQEVGPAGAIVLTRICEFHFESPPRHHYYETTASGDRQPGGRHT